MKVSPTSQKTTITMSTTDKKTSDPRKAMSWWKAGSKDERGNQMLTTADFLKSSQGYRYRQAGIYARLYGNLPLFSFVGSNLQKMDQSANLPSDRPTFNVIQSAIDTLVSRISQNRPSPTFLTDNGDYKQRTLAKKLNNFMQGEFHQTKAYEKCAFMLRDALIEGTGILKIYETPDHKVGLDRVFLTELLTDPSESIYGDPRQLYQIKLIDRSVLLDNFPEYRAKIEQAERAYVDNSSDSSKTVSDLVMVVEGWHLPSGPDAKDGRHTIACTAGTLIDEEYTKPKYPFIFLHYSERLLGFWSQGIAEQLMGTQVEINSLLFTISKAIKLVGVPRVFVEEGSKVVAAHNTNDIGVIIKYRGTKPIYEVAPCNAPELYEQLQRLIQYAYQQCGVSALQATSQKPQGLNSGEAIRSYDDISTDRFASLSRKFDNLFVDLAYAILDQAIDISKDQGKYQTVYPNKNGTKQIELPKLDQEKSPFVIQVFNMSSLPKDPAGRLQKITEMIQAGMVSIQEGRRLLDYPDLNQIETLANASEERIFQVLDRIIEEGKYTPPDPFMKLELAEELVVQYYNLYTQAKLEPEKEQMLRNFFTQIQALKNAAVPAAAPMGQPNAPQANAEALPSSPLVPNANPPQGAMPAA